MLSCLVETDADVTLDTGSKMDLSFQVELDANEKSSSLLLAGIISGTPQELACKVVNKDW